VSGLELVVRPDASVALREFAVPAPGPRQLLVRVLHSQVSAGSELRALRGSGAPDGTVVGYMQSGRVEAVGAAVEGFAPGDPVITYGHHCSHWLVDLDDASEVGLRRYVERVPDGVDLAVAGFAILGDVSVHAVRRARVELDQSVAVVGAGMVGQLAVQLARLCGADPIVVVDPVDERLDAALACGATGAVNPGCESTAEGVRRLTRGLGADVVLLCAPVASVLEDGVEAAADRGTVAVVGIAADHGRASIASLVTKELTIVGVYETGLIEPHWYWPWTPARNRRTCLELLASGRLRLDRLVTHRVPFGEAGSALAMVADPARAGEWLGVVIDWEEL
jgi:2-desacetyl-2-hydroxyethyl bacteriochlorophyllide A dehydrogenase